MAPSTEGYSTRGKRQPGADRVAEVRARGARQRSTRQIAVGLTNAQAAERLFLSPRTVDAHLQRIDGKPGVGTRAAAIRFAIDHGLWQGPT